MAKQPEFQTRNNAGELRFFSSFDDAFAAYKADRTIYKISWSIDNHERNRWIVKRKTANDRWMPTSEQKLEQLSAVYAAAPFVSTKNPSNGETIFWVNQLVMPPDYHENLEAYLKDREDQILWYQNCIQDILTEEQFKQRFSTSA